MRIHPTKIFIFELRNEIIWKLDHDGYSCGDISEIMNLEATWITRLIKRKPRKWKPKVEKVA